MGSKNSKSESWHRKKICRQNVAGAHLEQITPYELGMWQGHPGTRRPLWKGNAWQAQSGRKHL